MAPDCYACVQKYEMPLEAFTICAVDEWNPGALNCDKSKFSERMDFRSKTEDTVSDGNWYKYVSRSSFRSTTSDSRQSRHMLNYMKEPSCRLAPLRKRGPDVRHELC
jgi:hypothetical protein